MSLAFLLRRVDCEAQDMARLDTSLESAGSWREWVCDVEVRAGVDTYDLHRHRQRRDSRKVVRETS